MKRVTILVVCIMTVFCMSWAVAESSGGYSPAEVSAILDSYLKPGGEHFGEDLPDWLKDYFQGKTSTTVSSIVPSEQPEAELMGDDPTMVDILMEKTPVPAIYPVGERALSVGGTGEPGAVVTVEWPNGPPTVATVDQEGFWASRTDGASLHEFDIIRVKQRSIGLAASDDVEIRVGAKVVSARVTQVLPNPIRAGMNQIRGKGVPRAQIRFEWDNGVHRVYFNVSPAGDWSFVLPASAAFKQGDVLYIMQMEPGKAESETAVRVQP